MWYGNRFYGEKIDPDGLVLICSNEGQCWWQERKQAKTHISSLFDRVTPQTGDLIVLPDPDRMVVRDILVTEDKTLASEPYLLELPSRVSPEHLSLRPVGPDGRRQWYVSKEKREMLNSKRLSDVPVS